MKEVLSVEVRVECGRPFGPYKGSELENAKCHLKPGHRGPHQTTTKSMVVRWREKGDHRPIRSKFA